uniref:Swi1p n=1 Tax=Ganoderma boninense TaxID=34458 RepID=A0A5K1JXH6_9APHY|nr:Swi1p [Ganoderma boninense]
MSDHEAGGMPSDEDLSLPKATVTKMIAGAFHPRRVALVPPDTFARELNDLEICLELLPNEITCAKETRDLIIECCVGEVTFRHLHPRAHIDAPHADFMAEFIHLISSEANEICEHESKKTIAPEHIITALKGLGFESFTTEVESVLKDHKQQQKDREKKVSKLESSGLTEAELLAQQEALFAQSREKFRTAAQQ